MSDLGALYKLTGNDDYTTGVPERYLKLADDESGMPTADELAQSQFVEAVERIHEDTSAYPRFPWPSLADVTGPMCPEDLIIVAARTGGGKSLFLQNLWDRLICEGRFGTYVGLEQKAAILRVKWACLRRDIPPKLVLAPQPHEQGSPEWHFAMQAVQEDLKWQLTPEIKKRAHFSPARVINRAKLVEWTRWAIDHGSEFVILDHVDRVEHGDGKNAFHELSATIRAAKELAAKHRIVMILASQVGRPAEKLEQFMPPALNDLRGAGTKEEEADTVLGIYRPLKPGVKADELTRVRQGLQTADSIYEANTMGIRVLKHRLDGPASGRVVKLAVKHQRVFESPKASEV